MMASNQKEVQKVFNDIFGEHSKLKYCPVVSLWEDLCKVAAEECFSQGNNLDGVFLLSETHGLYLRHKAETSINYLLRRTLQRDVSNDRGTTKKDYIEYLTPETRRSLVGINTQFSLATGEGIIERLKDLPQEWTIVQVTSAFDVQFTVSPEKHRYSCPPSLHIVRMECGPNPAVITSKVDLISNTSGSAGLQFHPKSSQVIKSFLEELKDIITDDERVVKNGKKFTPKDYWMKREEHSQRMKVLLSSIENQYLKGWKCFFLGKLLNAEDERNLKALVDDVLASSACSNLSAHSRNILSLLLSALPNLQPVEVHRILRVALPDSPRKEIFDLMDAIEGIRETCLKTKPCKWKRHPVVLILDKRIEGVPWEMLPTLEGHPYSRVPSLHFAHCLSAERLKIKEAYIDASQGYYVVNPDGSLPKTEERLVEYLERRPETWRGKRGMSISPEEFVEVIKHHELVLYSGHGSGSQYMQDMQHRSEPLRAVMMLMGCGSASTQRLAAHLDPWGAVYKHLLDRSPCVIGMLWSVTDGECDAVTMNLLDTWLGPAQGSSNDRKDTKAKADVTKAKGSIQFSSRIPRIKGNISQQKTRAPDDLVLAQGDLLRAWTESRYAATQFMTSAAMVAYGMPVCATSADDMPSLLNKLSKMSVK